MKSLGLLWRFSEGKECCSAIAPLVGWVDASQPNILNQDNLSDGKGKLMSEDLRSVSSLLVEAQDKARNCPESSQSLALTAIGKALFLIAQELAAINQHLRKD